MQLELSPGQANDAPMAELLLNDLPRGVVVLADRAYDADWIRDVIEDQECKACIPPKANRTEPAPCSKRTYRKRNLIVPELLELSDAPRAIMTAFAVSSTNVASKGVPLRTLLAAARNHARALHWVGSAYTMEHGNTIKVQPWRRSVCLLVKLRRRLRAVSHLIRMQHVGIAWSDRCNGSRREMLEG